MTASLLWSFKWVRGGAAHLRALQGEWRLEGGTDHISTTQQHKVKTQTTEPVHNCGNTAINPSQHRRQATERITISVLATALLLRNLPSKNLRLWDLGSVLLQKCFQTLVWFWPFKSHAGHAKCFCFKNIFSSFLHKPWYFLPVIKGVRQNAQRVWDLMEMNLSLRVSRGDRNFLRVPGSNRRVADGHVAPSSPAASS